MMSGTFQRMSLLKIDPQLMQAGSALGVTRPHFWQGRRGAFASRPHRAHSHVPAPSGAPQYGHGGAPLFIVVSGGRDIVGL
jgi:hypothetical protein